MTDTVECLIAYCREGNRICSLPPMWNRLREMLPNRNRVGNSWQSSPPLILAAWHDTPSIQKMFRLAEHIEWAAQHGALGSVARFLRELREEDWRHVGE
jgi:hypothetical protein